MIFMFGRTVSGFGSRAKRGAAPLSLSLDITAGDLEVIGPAGGTATGTTNQAAYDGLVIAMDTSGDLGGEEHTGGYRIRCTVTDSASATATADFTLNVTGIVE